MNLISTLSKTVHKKKAFYYKMVLEPGILEYCVAWYSILPCSSTTWFFLMAQFPPQRCHGSKTPRNSSLRNSSSIKSGISLYSCETVFFYKIFQKFVVFGHFGLTLGHKQCFKQIALSLSLSLSTSIIFILFYLL